jgi:hypothetical protein
MNSLKILHFVLICLIFSINCFAQTPQFDLAKYQQFLDENADMTTSELLEMNPAGDFQEQVGAPWESVIYHDVIDAACKLTADEKQLLDSNGFVVMERLRQQSVVDQLLYIWRNDLPLFISTDAILHALGRSYDRIIKDVEMGLLIDRLSMLLTHMHNRLPDLDVKYSANPQMRPMLRDVDLYLVVARKLLGHNVSPLYSEDTSEINNLLTLIDQEEFASYPLFAQARREIDFSQFKPRGHYTQSEDLKKYFRAMMWLGRTEMYLSAPQATSAGNAPQEMEDIQRQTIDAVLLIELLDSQDAETLYIEIEDILTFLIGEQDNLTVPDLSMILTSLNLEDASQLLDPTVLQAFQDRLKLEGLGSQKILSQVLRQDPMAPESVQPASAFMLFGQRFIIDSYVTGNVVFDKIWYQGSKVGRLFPSTLDIIYTLGNDFAGQLLVPELDQYHYSTNLAALRFLVDSQDSSFWQSSVYSMWLDLLRTLNPPSERDDLPLFMQSAAWWSEKTNTQLASWAELRHNNILYAKQFYTPGFVCSYPSAYVEPFPEFYRGLQRLAEASETQFSNIAFSKAYLGTQIVNYFNRFSYIMQTLGTIAQKELDGIPPTEQEVTFMKEMLYMRTISVVCYSWEEPDGWYGDLLYGEEPVESAEAEGQALGYVVADYHTVPTDRAGNLVGWVLHAGTGPIDLGIITVPVPGSETEAFVGPMMSYYEYTTTNFQRLTDEEWETTYLLLATRPAWTSSYLVNESGEPDYH